MSLHEEIADIIAQWGEDDTLPECVEKVISKVREHDWDETMEYVKANRADERAKTIERCLVAVRKRIDPDPHSDTAYGVNIGLDMAERAIKGVGDE